MLVAGWKIIIMIIYGGMLQGQCLPPIVKISSDCSCGIDIVMLYLMYVLLNQSSSQFQSKHFSGIC